MAGSSMWNVGAVLKSHEVPPHILMTPGLITGKLSNIVPLVIRGPDEVHGIHLGASTQRSTSRIVKALTVGIKQGLCQRGDNHNALDMSERLTGLRLQEDPVRTSRFHCSTCKCTWDHDGPGSRFGNARQKTATNGRASQQRGRTFNGL